MATIHNSILKKFYWKDYLIILAGTFLYALGLTQFITPHKFVTGGLTGIGILINYASGIPISVSVFVLNAILLIIAFRILGSQFLIKTIFGVLSLTAFLGMFEAMKLTPIMMDEPLIAGLIGAIICGVGVGWVMSVNGSTGGTDIVVLIVNKYRNVTPGRTMLAVDVLIVCSSYIILKNIETIVLGLIIIAVMASSVDYVINGVRQSVQFFIFSQKYDEIADAVNTQLHRGCTVLDGTGWYSKQPQNVLVILAKKTESVSIFRIVKAIDPNAFISQSSVIGVYGEGFEKIKGK